MEGLAFKPNSRQILVLIQRERFPEDEEPKEVASLEDPLMILGTLKTKTLLK